MIRIPENISRVTKTTSGEKKETKSCFLNNDGRLLSGSNPKKTYKYFLRFYNDNKQARL